MKGLLKRRPVDSAQAELLKSKRPAVDDALTSKLQCGLPAINLCESSALITAYCNDVDPKYFFAQQVFDLGKKGDILIGLSTSGNAKNVNHAAKIARAMGLTVIGMTGKLGGKLDKNSNICIKAPQNSTYLIQELHLPIYHEFAPQLRKLFLKTN